MLRRQNRNIKINQCNHTLHKEAQRFYENKRNPLENYKKHRGIKTVCTRQKI